MAADGGHRILSRMAGITADVAPPEPPVTPGRVLRRAVSRAGEALHLALGVVAIDDIVRSLDAILADLDESLLVLALTEAEVDRGFAVLDLGVRDALVEVQTLGALSTRPSPQGAARRPVTAADAALAIPFLERILGELAKAGPGTDLPEWIGASAIAGRFGSRRVIGATLPAGAYRCVALSIDLGGQDREGRLTIVLPPPGAVRPGTEAETSAHWAETFRSGVLDASAVLTAVLARHRLSLAEAEALRPGQVLPLPGVTVGSVRLEAPLGQALAAARLGQFAGLRAVRLQLPRSPELRDALPGLGTGALGLSRIADAEVLVDGAALGRADPWAGTDGLAEAEPAPPPALDWSGAEQTATASLDLAADVDPEPPDDGPPGPFEVALAECRGGTETPHAIAETADASEAAPRAAALADLAPEPAALPDPELPPPPVAPAPPPAAAPLPPPAAAPLPPPAAAPASADVPSPGAAVSASDPASDPAPEPAAVDTAGVSPAVSPDPVASGSNPAPATATDAKPALDPAPATASAARPDPAVAPAAPEPDPAGGDAASREPRTPADRAEPVFARGTHRPVSLAAGSARAAGSRRMSRDDLPPAAPFALDDEPAPEVDVNGEETPGTEIAIGLDLTSLGIEDAD